eukprot:4723775-Amphidinium_carterae.2
MGLLFAVCLFGQIQWIKVPQQSLVEVGILYLNSSPGRSKVAVERRLEAACALAEAVEEDQGGQHVALHIIRLS